MRSPRALFRSLVFGVIAASLIVCGHQPQASAQRIESLQPARSHAGGYGNLPVAFIENRGQTDRRVAYYALGERYGFYLTRDEVMLSFAGAGTNASAPAEASHNDDALAMAVALRFVHANPARRIEGDTRAPGAVNYFRGSDPANWRTEVPRYTGVAYRELWPGVDLRLHEERGALKYEFHVRPGARPSDIRLAHAGTSGVSLDGSGALSIATPMGTLRDAAPVSYQLIDGRRVPVATHYALFDQPASGSTEASFGFVIGRGYQPDRELVIDPGVEYSTFLGGSSHEIGAGIQADAAGNVYIVGTTQSPDFPVTPGAFKRTGAAGNFSDVFVTKLNPTGTALVYSTFIGGSNFDWGRAIAIDAAGSAYVTGQTKSTNFPTTSGAFDRTINVDTSCPRCGIDPYDAFVLKLNPSGSALVYSSFLGGFDIDDGLGIAIDAAGNAYVAGETASLNFPTTASAFDRTYNGSNDVFLTKVNTTGSAIVYSTYIGGTAVEFATHVAVDSGGSAYLVGSTSSTDYPVTAGAFDTSQNGAFDVFVTKVNAAGSALVYSTFLGGSGFDSGSGIAVDAAGNAYVTGGAGSTNFPTTPGAFSVIADGSDAFIAKLNAAGSALVYSTTLGGSAGEGANAIAIDAAGQAWVTGITSSVDFPLSDDAFGVAFHGVADAFVAELSADGSTLLYATYLGGTLSDGGDGIALDPHGNAYVSGHTYSLDFPTTANAFDVVFNGDPSIFWGDAFVTKFAIDSGGSPPPPPPPPPPQTATLTVSATGRSGQRVSSAPAGINVATGSSASASFTTGVSITLSVSNGRDAIWSGACSSGGSKKKSCTFTLNSAATVAANVQ